MKTKLFPILFHIMELCLLFVIVGIPAARAELISLDPIANAGWYADDLTKTHLYIKDPVSGDYYYEWNYGQGVLPWNSLNGLVVDLGDSVLDITPGGITVDGWLIESGGDVFNDPGSAIWKSMSLPKGSYELTLTSGAYNLEAYWGKDAWNAYAQIWADYGDGSDGDSFSFGEGFPPFNSEGEALEYYDDYVLNIYLAQAADLYFYINDWNSVDNAGSSVTLDIKSTAVPEPASLLLVCSGLIGLASFRRKFKKA